jgi:hypothetical protein
MLHLECVHIYITFLSNDQTGHIEREREREAAGVVGRRKHKYVKFCNHWINTN